MWVVYGAMLPNNDSKWGLQGPLPLKRWDGERTRYKARKSVAPRSSENARSYNERRAVAYAEWLAQRDSIVLPTHVQPRALYGDRQRIKAVSFGAYEIEIPNWDFEHPPIEACEG